MNNQRISLEELEARLIILKHRVQKHVKDVEELLESAKKNNQNSHQPIHSPNPKS